MIFKRITLGIIFIVIVAAGIVSYLQYKGQLPYGYQLEFTILQFVGFCFLWGAMGGFWNVIWARRRFLKETRAKIVNDHPVYRKYYQLLLEISKKFKPTLSIVFGIIVKPTLISSGSSFILLSMVFNKSGCNSDTILCFK